MSPLSLLYLLLASPMFGSHFDLEHESMPSTWSPSWSNWTPENWTPSNWSPMWPSWTPETPSFFPGSSGRFPESTERINWLLRKAIRSTTSRRSILRELTGYEHTPFTTSTYDHVVIEKLIRNVKIISRIATKNPALLEAILTCPKTRFILSKVLRTVEPETLKLVERLVRKTIVPKVFREVERTVAKKLIRSVAFSSPRSIYSTKNVFDNVYSPEHLVMSKIVRRLIKNVAEPRSEFVMKKLIKKALRGNTPFNFNPEMCNVCESVCTGGWSYSTPFSYNLPICKMCTKMCPTTSPFTSSKLIKKVVRKALAKDLIKAVVNPFSSSFKHGNTNFCSICSTVCEPFSWYTTPMTSSWETPSSICNTCNTVCRSERFNTYKLAKKLNKLSRWSSIF